MFQQRMEDHGFLHFHDTENKQTNHDDILKLEEKMDKEKCRGFEDEFTSRSAFPGLSSLNLA